MSVFDVLPQCVLQIWPGLDPVFLRLEFRRT